VVYEPHLTLRVVPPQKVVRFGRVCRIVFGGASTVSDHCAPAVIGLVLFIRCVTVVTTTYACMIGPTATPVLW